MTTKSIPLALASGLATFLVVGIVVTGFLQQWINFALLLGLPIGFVSGATAAGAVTVGLTGDVSNRRRRATGAFAGLSVGFLAGFLFVSRVLSHGMESSVVAGLAVGFTLCVWLSFEVENWDTQL